MNLGTHKRVVYVNNLVFIHTASGIHGPCVRMLRRWLSAVGIAGRVWPGHCCARGSEDAAADCTMKFMGRLKRQPRGGK
jgi:hypothetical protein